MSSVPRGVPTWPPFPYKIQSPSHLHTGQVCAHDGSRTCGTRAPARGSRLRAPGSPRNAHVLATPAFLSIDDGLFVQVGEASWEVTGMGNPRLPCSAPQKLLAADVRWARGSEEPRACLGTEPGARVSTEPGVRARDGCECEATGACAGLSTCTRTERAPLWVVSLLERLCSLPAGAPLRTHELSSRGLLSTKPQLASWPVVSTGLQIWGHSRTRNGDAGVEGGPAGSKDECQTKGQGRTLDARRFTPGGTDLLKFAHGDLPRRALEAPTEY